MAKKERDEPLLLNTMPEASNSLNSRSLFFQRKLYDKLAFSSSLISPRKPIDFWNEKPYYGRSDIQARAIHLSERHLVQLPITGDAVFAVNFVADAFSDLTQYFAFLRGRGAINESGPYANFQPVRGWQSINTSYHQLMEVIYTKFKSYLLAYKKEAAIKDFNSFMIVFAEFVDSVTPLVPMTRTKLILSEKTSPLISGLALELSDALFSEDLPKVANFLEDANFPIFNEAAQRFGFKVDKHAPWRIVADIGSPAMAPYLAKYGLTATTVIDKCFYKSHLYDIDTLKTYVIEFYNSYVTSKPIIVRPDFKVKNGKVKVCTKELVRAPQEKVSLDEEYGSEYWLRFYTFVRAREENLSWDQAKFEIFAKNANFYAIGKDPNTAADYIDRKVKNSSGSSKKERNFYFSAKKRSS